MGDTTGTPVTDPVLTGGQPATFGSNAFATIQDALLHYQVGTTTAIIVNPGDYTGTTTINSTTPANIVLQGGAVIIDSLDGSANAQEMITIPAGSSLTVDSTATTNSYIGTIVGAGSFVKQGTGTLTLTQANSSFSGPIEVAGGTLQIGNGSVVIATGGSGGSIPSTPTATLAFKEPGTAAVPTTIANAIGGAGNLTILGSASAGRRGPVGRRQQLQRHPDDQWRPTSFRPRPPRSAIRPPSSSQAAVSSRWAPSATSR